MIALGLPWTSATWVDASRIAPSLGLFAGAPASVEYIDRAALAFLASPRAKPGRGWRAARSPAGAAVLLHGWIDNADELRARLDIRGSDPASLYGAAIDTWGDAGEHRVVGHYAAIMLRPDQTIRLSRSPWSGPPLVYAHDEKGCVAASVSRVLLAAGHPERIDRAKLIAALAMQIPGDEDSMLEGVRQVPHGSIVTIDRNSRRVDRWYDPCACPEVRFARDDDYVEAARALLDEAAKNALSMAARPGVELSGGLDSSLVCDAVLRRLPAGRRLPSFTFHPHDGVDLGSRARSDDERHFVRAFADRRPELEPVFVDNADAGFDSMSQEMFLAAGKVQPGWALGYPFQGVLRAARDRNCDWLLGATYGDENLSNAALWAMPEFVRSGRWSEAVRLARTRTHDPRPVWRRIVSLGIMPHLPPWWRHRASRLFGRSNAQPLLTNRLLDRAALANVGIDRDGPANITSFACFPASRPQWLRENYFGLGLGGELQLATEQVFGVRRRDVTAYRPLTEFCAGIPTDQFVRGGVTRFLARRLAIGILPEEQRLRPDHAMHTADWHARMGARLDDLRGGIDRAARQPELAGLFDFDFARSLVDAWPDSPPAFTDPRFVDLQFFLPATLLVSRYVDFVSGRNEG